MWNDDSATARLVLPRVKDRLRALGLPGRPVVFVVSRKAVIVAGSDDAEHLIAAARAAEYVAWGEHLISAPPLVLDGDAWRVWEPEDSAVREAIAQMRALIEGRMPTPASGNPDR